MSEWKETTLGSLAEYRNGKARPKSEVGEIPVYGGNGILGYTNTSNIDDQTVVVGRVGAYCGSVFYSYQPIWVSDNAIGIKARPGTHPKFLYYLLKNYNLNDYAEGSSHPLLTQGLISSLSTCVPELKQQIAIAEVLSSLDDKIDLLHRNNRTLKQMAETLFRQWFVKEKQNGWSKHVLGDHLTVLRGLSYKGSGLTDVNDPLAVPMVNLNSIYEGGGFKQEGLKYYKGEYKERHVLHPKDIVLANTEQGHEYRLIGYPAMVPKSVGEKAIFSQHVFKVVSNTENLPPIFLLQLLSTPHIREQILGATNGTTVNMLSSDGIERAVANLPPYEKIKEFEEIVTPFYEKKEVNNSHLNTIQHLRDTLLPKLMSGEVRAVI
jgi:type I restriction enzyme, S subunit